VIFIDNIENFLEFMDNRLMDQIFYEFNEIKNGSQISKDIKIEIIIHFLAKVKENLVLFETKQLISKTPNSKTDEEVVETLQGIFQKVEPSLNLIKGKIREIFLSRSS